MTVRFVRFMPAFFADVDTQLRPARGPSGEPSRIDFVEYEVPAIRQALSTRFDELPPLTRDRTDYRELVSTGRTVRAYAVVAQLMTDGTIEVLGLAIEPWSDADHDLDPDADE